MPSVSPAKSRRSQAVARYGAMANLGVALESFFIVMLSFRSKCSDKACPRRECSFSDAGHLPSLVQDALREERGKSCSVAKVSAMEAAPECHVTCSPESVDSGTAPGRDFSNAKWRLCSMGPRDWKQ